LQSSRREPPHKEGAASLRGKHNAWQRQGILQRVKHQQCDRQAEMMIEEKVSVGSQFESFWCQQALY
jgi:hypothetical protein